MAGEHLRVMEGIDRGRRLSIDVELLIGRAAPDAAGRLGDDPELSRRHAYVCRNSDGRLTIEDLGSANGTFVNDARIDVPRTLDLGDVVRVGKTVLQVTDRSGEVPQTPPSEAPAATRPARLVEASHVLVVTSGAAVGRSVDLVDEILIGRGVSGEGLLAEDPELSRRHARVLRGPDGQLVVEDLGSANGTFVNGERVRGRRVLEAGDLVRVGSTTLQLREAVHPPAPAPAPTPVAARERPRRPAVPAAAPPAPAIELAPGAVFAGCRVQEVIGHGDMGVVYRAEELALQRPIALKLILSELAREERFRERFRRESRIAAALDHPNVIPIFDAGEETGVLFIMMRLVEGTDLRAVIDDEGPLQPLRAARIVRQVAAALDTAHARGILHRDVKPSNVLLAREDHAYLSDFGLAKPAASAGGVTRQGTVIARAEYVAPEQILNQRVDARADIYAMGCLLFETLTGEPPFATSGVDHGALAHLEAPRPSPLELRPDLPPEFDEVVRRAMAKDPSDRYPSAGDFGEAALVAAGGLRRARAWSVVATGEAAFSADEQAAEPPPPRPEAPAPAGSTVTRGDPLRWAIAIAGLVLVAAGMVAALHGISTL